MLLESSLRPASNAAIGIISSKTVPNLRSAINSSPKNGSLVLKNGECKGLLDVISVSVVIADNNLVNFFNSCLLE